MPTEKNTGSVTFKTSGTNTTYEIAVPTGTRLRDTLKVIEIVKVEAIKKFQPGACTQCHSGRDYRLRELAHVLPEKPSKNIVGFDLKSGKLIG
jgi:hypothetical protein